MTVKLSIDPRAPQPPSEQIADQIRFAIASGRLRAAERLPSVRALAESAVVNPNTVAKVYRDLERDGVVTTRPGDGVFVATTANVICRALRDDVLEERFARVIADALAGGLDPRAISDWVERALGRASVGGKR